MIRPEKTRRRARSRTARRCFGEAARADASARSPARAPALAAGHDRPDRLTGLNPNRRGRDDAVVIGEAGEDLDFTRALGAERDMRWRYLAVDNAPHRLLLHRAGRHEQRVASLAQDDIGLGRHADHQRRILWQRDTHPIRTRDGIALRRDRLYRAMED